MDENNILSSLAEWASPETLVEEQPSIPAHLVQLPGGRWTIWRWVGLRSAGFPIEPLLRLGDSGCAAAADELCAAEDRLQQIQDGALQALRDLLEHVSAESRALVVKAIQQLKKRQVPAMSAVPEAEAALASLREAAPQAQAAATAFQQAYQTALAQTTQALSEIARDRPFREALTWQNRNALHTGVDAFLRKPPDTTARSSKYRQHEALIVNYVQRYCTKNDTIGFFGPVGWARVADGGAAASIRPGAALLAARTVYFDGWCIDALAEALAKDDALGPWLVPRRLPHIHVDGTTLYLPLAPPSPLPVAQAAVLRGCDGERTAKQLAADLLKSPASGLRSEAEVYAVLKKLRALRRITWTLEVPAEGLHPEHSLRRRLQQIEDLHTRTAALGALAELEQAREAIRGAAGDPDRLDQAMEDLEATFTRLTGTAATRRAGATYAGRTLVYEDCRRDVDVTLGPGVVEALGLPLMLMLASARWFTYEAAQLYLKAFASIYAELARKTSARTVEFTSFWYMAHPLIFDKEASHIAPLVSELQRRWAAIFDLESGRQQVEYAGEHLRERVHTAFDAPHPGWSSARYHSPNIMIAAASVEAINQGQFQCVMGELHPGANTLKTALFVGQHPAAHELFQAIESDLPDPQVVVVGTREEGGPTLRLSTALLSPRDFRFVFAHDSVRCSRRTGATNRRIGRRGRRRDADRPHPRWAPTLRYRRADGRVSHDQGATSFQYHRPITVYATDQHRSAGDLPRVVAVRTDRAGLRGQRERGGALYRRATLGADLEPTALCVREDPDREEALLCRFRERQRGRAAGQGHSPRRRRPAPGGVNRGDGDAARPAPDLAAGP